MGGGEQGGRWWSAGGACVDKFWLSSSCHGVFIEERRVGQGRQSLSFMRCHMTIVSCSYSLTIIHTGRARYHNPFLFPLEIQFWRVMVSVISASSVLKIFLFKFSLKKKKGSSVCICFKKLRAWVFGGWFNDRNVGRNKDIQ